MEPATIQDLIIAVNQLDQTIAALMSFDPDLFTKLLGGCVLAFLSGHGAGVIVRLLNRT